MGTGFACRSVSTLWAAPGIRVESGGDPARLSMNRCVVGSRVGFKDSDGVNKGFAPVRATVLAPFPFVFASLVVRIALLLEFRVGNVVSA